MARIAHCSCSSLRVERTGEPTVVVACFIRDGQAGRKLRFHFCRSCGTTVYWEADLRPHAIGIALGRFADPSFAAPARSVWEESRHSWVEFGHELGHSPQAPTVVRPPG